jgi:hypothetical protein
MRQGYYIGLTTLRQLPKCIRASLHFTTAVAGCVNATLARPRMHDAESIGSNIFEVNCGTGLTYAFVSPSVRSKTVA